MNCKLQHIKFRLNVFLGLFLLLSTILPGCGQEKSSPFDVPATKNESRPNILLVTLDTCRQDRIGCYGFHFAHTQAIDSMAEEGVVCTNAIAATPITLPSHSTIMTGLLPPAHGVRANGTYVLSDKALTLAEILKDAGYSTHGIVSAEVLNRRYNLSQGFDEYNDELWDEDNPKTFMIRDRPAQKTAKLAIEMLEGWKNSPKVEEAPFFMWMHLFDPHQPWKANIPNRQMLPTPYDAEIAQADDGVEAVINWLEEKGDLDNTLVVITADHGESLGEHGEDTHSIFVYDATVKIPMVWRYPGRLPAGTKTDQPVHQADIVPTILSLLDMPEIEGVQGIDVTDWLKGEKGPQAQPQYSESLLSEVGFGMAPLYAVRHEGYKYIKAPRPELYDLTADPQELTNIHDQHPDRVAELSAMLESLITDSEAMNLPAQETPMDDETLEMLEALGYISSETDRESMGGMDPKDAIVLHKKLAKARHLVQQKKWRVAESDLRSILEESPGHITAHNILGMVLWKQGRAEEAEQAYGDSLALQPQQYRILQALGGLKLDLGHFEEASQLFLQTIELQPHYIEAKVFVAHCLAQLDDAEGAAQWLNKAREQAPDSPLVDVLMAKLYFKKNHYEQALLYYEAALAIQAQHYEALVESGLCQMRLEKYDESIALFEQAKAHKPKRWEAEYNLACLYALTDDVPKAIDSLRSMLDGQTPELRGKLVNAIGRDKDLISLRELPEFDTLLKEFSKPPKE